MDDNVDADIGETATYRRRSARYGTTQMIAHIAYNIRNMSLRWCTKVYELSNKR